MKRRKRTHRKKGLSSHAPAHRRRKRGLFDGVMSGANLKGSAINVGLGALGGAGASIGTKLTNTLTKGNMIANVLVGALVGFVASSLGAPKIGIGYAGGSTALALAGGLKDNANFAEEDALEEGEIFTTEDGQLIKMLNDGQMQYLSEEEAQAYLNDENVIYPEYGTMNMMQH